MDRTLDRADGGLGIGLTLVRRLVEMHDGTVQAFSEGPGMGSEFIIRLPLSVSKVVTTSETQVSTPVAPVSGRRVLVVDDNRDSAESIAVLLRLCGNDVRTTHDGRLAVEIALAYRPDVILLDIGLPKMNGLEVCRHLRLDPNMQKVLIVAMTGYGQEEDRLRSQKAGFDVHLVKPVDLQQLYEMLARPHLLNGEQLAVPV
jgi:CheY-like chemotaxis protein